MASDYLTVPEEPAVISDGPTRSLNGWRRLPP